MTEVDLVGDLYHILTRLAEELRDARATRTPARAWTTSCSAASRPAKRRRRVPDAAAARAVGDPPGARARATC